MIRKMERWSKNVIFFLKLNRIDSKVIIGSTEGILACTLWFPYAGKYFIN